MKNLTQKIRFKSVAIAVICAFFSCDITWAVGESSGSSLRKATKYSSYTQQTDISVADKPEKKELLGKVFFRTFEMIVGSLFVGIRTLGLFFWMISSSFFIVMIVGGVLAMITRDPLMHIGITALLGWSCWKLEKSLLERRLSNDFFKTVDELSPKSVWILMSLSKDRKDNIREEAISALGVVGMGNKNAVRRVIKALRDKDKRVRKVAVYALRNVNYEAESSVSVIESLRMSLEDEDGQVRKVAEKALIKISGKRVVASWIRELDVAI